MSPLEIVFAVLAAAVALLGGYWTLVKIIVGQFKQHLKDKFDAQDKARDEGRSELRGSLAKLQEDNRKLERDHLKLLADLPMYYVRREDHIRFETVIDAKLGALNTKLDLIAERQLNDRQQSKDS